MRKTLTMAMLKKAGACQSQLDLFKTHFGKGGEVTLEKCLSVAGVFNWDWAAENLLSPPARAAYDAALAPAWAAYAAALATAFANVFNLGEPTA